MYDLYENLTGGFIMYWLQGSWVEQDKKAAIVSPSSHPSSFSSFPSPQLSTYLLFNPHLSIPPPFTYQSIYLLTHHSSITHPLISHHSPTYHLPVHPLKYSSITHPSIYIATISSFHLSTHPKSTYWSTSPWTWLCIYPSITYLSAFSSTAH